MKTTTAPVKTIGFIGNPSSKSICVTMLAMYLQKEFGVAQFYYMTLYNNMGIYNNKNKATEITDLIIETIWEMVGDKKGLQMSNDFTKKIIQPVMKYNQQLANQITRN